MNKNNLRKGTLWAIAFLVIFLLSQDYFFIKWEPNVGALGLPNWMFWFVGVHIVFIITFYFFSKKYWKD